VIFVDRATRKNENGIAHPNPIPLDEESKRVILFELERVLASRLFRSSGRYKQFLSYVVRNSLEGHVENLKERIIGTEVFQRDPDYATGDDAVVRVNAGEVRRRLEQYYYAAPKDTPVRIEIPIGSYAPEFRWTSKITSTENHPHSPHVQVADESAQTVPEKQNLTLAGKSRHWLKLAVTLCLGLGLAGLLVTLGIRHQRQPTSAAGLFWSPVLDSSRPVLICIPQAVVYRPAFDVYEKYSLSHPGTFQTELQRLTEELPLDPSDKISWKDIEHDGTFGVAVGDAYAGFSISSRLAQMGKASQFRIGGTCSFEDLRNFSSVVIGAYDDRWTMEMASNLHFAFQWDHRIQEFPRIKENIPSGRVWAAEVGPHFHYSVDYGIVTRLVDSATGQPLISIGGLGTAGTQAAGELISNPQYLDEALRNAPKEWNKRNVQIVVQAKVTDAIPSPPRVVAAYFW
jgi:hypothetical protein